MENQKRARRLIAGFGGAGSIPLIAVVSWILLFTLPCAGAVQPESKKIQATKKTVLPYVKVLSPNGAEKWQLGTHQTIRWSSQRISGDVKLVLLSNGKQIGNIVDKVSASGGSYSWQVGKYKGGTVAPASGYKVRVETVDGKYKDDSDKPFSVKEEAKKTAAVSKKAPSLTTPSLKKAPSTRQTPPAGKIRRSIRIVYPTQKDVLTLGSSKTIRWSSSGISGNAKLVLLQGNNRIGLITKDIPVSSGNYKWVVGKHQRGMASSGPGYKIQIEAMNGLYICQSESSFALITRGAGERTRDRRRRPAPGTSTEQTQIPTDTEGFQTPPGTGEESQRVRQEERLRQSRTQLRREGQIRQVPDTPQAQPDTTETVTGFIYPDFEIKDLFCTTEGKLVAQIRNNGAPFEGILESRISARQKEPLFKLNERVSGPINIGTGEVKSVNLLDFNWPEPVAEYPQLRFALQVDSAKNITELDERNNFFRKVLKHTSCLPPVSVMDGEGDAPQPQERPAAQGRHQIIGRPSARPDTLPGDDIAQRAAPQELPDDMPPRGVEISGYVRFAHGRGQRTVQILFHGSEVPSTMEIETSGDGSNYGHEVTQTGREGYYSQRFPSGWSGTVLPGSRAISPRDGCFLFVPSKYEYGLLHDTVKVEQNFTIYRNVIRGSVNIPGDPSRGRPIEGVRMRFSGGIGSTETDTSGNYQMPIPAAYSGTITPVKEDFTFSPESQDVNNFTNKTADWFKDFAGTCQRVTISGRLTAGDDTPIAGRLIYFGAPMNYELQTRTDNEGYYILKVPFGWSGDWQPRGIDDEYELEPESRRVTNLDRPIENMDFHSDVIQRCISGRVFSIFGRPCRDLTIGFYSPEMSGGHDGRVTTNEEGRYAIYVPHGWSGRVQAHTYIGDDPHVEPDERTYENVTSDINGQFFETSCWYIHGWVLDNTKRLRGVTIKFLYDSGGFKTVETDSNGEFTIYVPNRWSGTVTARKEGYLIRGARCQRCVRDDEGRPASDLYPAPEIYYENLTDHEGFLLFWAFRQE